MTAPELLNRVEVRLDQISSSSTFWATADIYKALSDGQREIVNFILAVFDAKRKVNLTLELPEALKALAKTDTGITIADSSDALPNDYLYCLDVEYGATSGTKKPAFQRPASYRSHGYANSYLGGTSFYRIAASTIFFEDGSSDHYWTLQYLMKPTEITAAPINPILPDFTHEAIVNYAVGVMLQRDQRLSEAQSYFNDFFKLVQNFM